MKVFSQRRFLTKHLKLTHKIAKEEKIKTTSDKPQPRNEEGEELVNRNLENDELAWSVDEESERENENNDN